VAFASQARKLVPGDTNESADVFVRALGPLAPCTGTDYAGAVRCALPRSYWRLDERAGSVAADDAGGAPATYRGGRLGQPGPVAGGALGLNLHARARREHVDAGDVHDFPDLLPFSLEAWVKPRDLDAHTARIVSKEHAGAGYLLGVDADGAAFSRYVLGSAQTVRAPLQPGRWTHVVATYDGARMTLFLDGREAAARPSAIELPAHRGHLVLGAKSGRWRYFAGWLDEVAVYPVALDAATVVRHFERGTSLDAVAP
jgi:hypothetical protein